MKPIVFRAPWSRSLRLRTIALSLLIALLAAAGFFLSIHASWVWQFSLIVLPIAIWVVSLLTMVRGYSLDDERFSIHRLAMWETYSLRDLASVDGDAEATRGSICLLANCGLFSFSGRYWSRHLGLYRASLCDPARAVIIRMGGSTLVIAPHDPQQFIVRARTFIKTLDFPP